MREHHCARCGYDLVGLPPEGNCPECGRGFDKATRRGVAGPAEDGDAGTKLKRRFAAGMAALALVLVAVGGAVSLGSPDPLRPVAFGLVAAGVCLVVGLFPLSR